MKRLPLVVFFTFMMTLVASGQSSSTEINNEASMQNWELLDEMDYSIQFPDTFDLDQSGKMGIQFILFSQPTSQQDLFRENVNLLIQDLTGQNINLDTYVEISEGQINTMLTDGNLIESKRISDKNYQRMIYTGKQGQFHFKWLQYCWIENQKAYVLTLTCEENQYDNYLAIGDKIMKTFVIKEK